MMRPRTAAAALTASLTVVALSACQSPAEKKAAPPIRTIATQTAPAQDKLPIVKSEPVQADPEKAMRNYKELLKLKPDDDTRAEALRRTADLHLQLEDAKGNVNPAAVQSSIETYKKLLADRPKDRNNDRVLYQLARAYQASGQMDQSVDTLATLTHDFPESPLTGDAHFRRAELLYSLDRYAEAEKEYQFVLGLGTRTSFFESAQYKYGWSLFKQSKYDPSRAVFFAILERELPPGELEDPEPALAGVQKSKADLASSSLRVCSLSFAAENGGKSVNDYYARIGREPRFYALVYNALGDLFVEKRRYSDAAAAYAAFIERHPQHASAPKFQTRVIAAYQQGGFNDLVVREKERYVTAYAPGAPYWAGKAPTAEVVAELRRDYEDLGRHYQAKAQAEAKAAPGSGQTDFITAAGWYRKVLEFFPNDPKIAEINLLYADALFDGGKTSDAAEQYLKTAYGYGDHPRAQEAAYAAIQAWQRLATEVPAEQRDGALRQSVDASLKLADTFPTHPKWAPVVTKAAEDLFAIKALDEAIAVAGRLLAAQPPAAVELRRTALGVVADSRFAQAKYPEAEVAYSDLLALVPPGSPQRQPVVEQLAASIYKQGEAARDAGDLRTAADTFLRVGRVVPEASIRPKADYDAASAYYTLADWPAAEQTLESFRGRYPQHPLLPDVDKKLAVAYQKDGKPAQAAEAYTRIAQRTSESLDTRREAGWLAATLYDEAKLPPAATRAYEAYVAQFPEPLERGMQARRRLADLALANGDRVRTLRWLREMVAVDGTAGGARTDLTRQMAAQAALELGLDSAQAARGLRITLPVAKTLPARKNATELAVAALERAAAYGFADTTTAATHELGNVYRDFGRALLESEKPKNLKADELEQYNILLEEQADPFDQKAITAYEANLKRLEQNLWNDSIRKSAAALAELAPAKYGKREVREETYDTLR